MTWKDCNPAERTKIPNIRQKATNNKEDVKESGIITSPPLCILFLMFPTKGFCLVRMKAMIWIYGLSIQSGHNRKGTLV